MPPNDIYDIITTEPCVSAVSCLAIAELAIFFLYFRLTCYYLIWWYWELIGTIYHGLSSKWGRVWPSLHCSPRSLLDLNLALLSIKHFHNQAWHARNSQRHRRDAAFVKELEPVGIQTLWYLKVPQFSIPKNDSRKGLCWPHKEFKPCGWTAHHQCCLYDVWPACEIHSVFS